MRKVLPIIVMGMVVLSGLGAASFTTNLVTTQIPQMKQESLSVMFSSQPVQIEKDGFIQIQMEGTTTHLVDQNKPVLPIYVKTYQIPFRSTDIQVTCTPKQISTAILTKTIEPARIAPVSELDTQLPYVKDPAVYESSAFYPDTWSSYELGAGRNENNQQVTFVKVIGYPIRYSPTTNTITYTDGFDIQVTYNRPQTVPQSTGADYDMVVIAPEKFSASLTSLIDFKNSKGIVTKFKSVESILTEYDGYDAPEKIKYFIKNEFDTSNITDVLLVGGLKNHIYAKDKDTRSAGWKAWWVPVRYVSMPNEDDEGCLSDLYYGCLYNGTGGFDSWDSNGDGVYAAWNAPGAQKDTFDMYPEVYVSRLPVANTMELKRIVKKILTYESTGPTEKSSWYNNFIGVAGKTFYTWQGKPDGEYLCDVAYNYTKLAIPGLKLIPVYSSNRDTGGLVPTYEDIPKAFNQGASFVDFEGHGYPLGWNCIWFDGEYNNHDWVGGITTYRFWRIQNGDKLPVVIVGGCHNGLYNITMIPTMLDTNGTRYFTFGLPGAACFCWALILKPTGGAIASTGCTGYGIGSQSGDPATILSAALESNFFYEIGHGSTHLAQTHSQAIRKYLEEHSLTQTDAFCITNWALFGDASLLFGGYSS